MSAADLLALQGHIKTDPDGYRDEFDMQRRNYEAKMKVFLMKPAQDAKDFADLCMFLAQVSHCFPEELKGFPGEVMALLDKHYAVLTPPMRRSLVQVLMLLKSRGRLQATDIFPLFFRLFRCQDKALRQQLQGYMVSDVRNANRKHRNERLNRAIQSLMYGVLEDDNEAAAKKALAILTELYRRNVWRDAHTVNVIGSACHHRSSKVMLAALRFFLGLDQAADEDGASDSEDEDAEKDLGVAGPSKAEIYSATKKGTSASKRKKKKKLARVMATLKKQARKEQGGAAGGFAALELLHDPQAFAERLFARLRGGGEKFEARVAIMQVVSRAIGTHRLLVLPFYPFLQRYMMPRQKDVTQVLAALVQACHDLVPPETLRPVLRQLVDNFVHDRAREEVMTIGLKTVREMCLRQPLVMDEDLLQDLVQYKKHRDKQVSAAARSLMALFREIAPGMLERKDRGRGHEIERTLGTYGERKVSDRIEGADLLEQALKKGLTPSEIGASDDEEDEDEDEDASGEGTSDGGDDGSEEGVGGEDGEGAFGTDDEGVEGDGSDAEGVEVESDEEEGDASDGDADGDSDGEAGEEDSDADDSEDEPQGKPKPAPQAGSLADLKRRLAEAKRAKEAPGEQEGAGGDGKEAGDSKVAKEGVPEDWGRVFSQEEFEAIRRLKQRQTVQAAMTKHGLRTASKRKAGEIDVDDELRALLARGAERIAERRVDAAELEGVHKRRKTKEERLASVMEGREGREEFGAASARRKKKTGGAGLSNREKQKRKVVPLAARMAQINRRRGNKKHGKGKGGGKQGKKR
ncbi:unnamed protein product [Pedinophyceae sp. YPF-701]|nr:unnamed protein product [Pedinophyceae sp. YPF-701]